MKRACQSVSSGDVRTIASQMLQCLNFLSAMGLTHTDAWPQMAQVAAGPWWSVGPLIRGAEDIKCRNAMLKDSRGDMAPWPSSMTSLKYVTHGHSDKTLRDTEASLK